MKKLMVVLAAVMLILIAAPHILISTLAQDKGKSEHDKYLENGRFKVDTPYCEKNENQGGVCRKPDRSKVVEGQKIKYPPPNK